MSKKLLVGFIAGAVAGTVLGTLLAPRKGSKTRAKIAETISDCLERIKDSFRSIDERIIVDTDEATPDWEHSERPYVASKV
jgi:gas vesicle protein